MELGVRDWMMIVGILLIAVVLVDGFRRMRNDRRGRIRMSLNKNFVNSSGDVDEVYSTELPGGPRVVPRKRGDALADDQPVTKLGSDDLQLDEDVPMLMESISATAFDDKDLVMDESIHSHSAEAEQESELSAQAESLDEEPVEQERLSPQKVRQEQQPQQQEIEAFKVDHNHHHSSAKDLSNHEVIVINVMAKDQPFKGADLLHILLACDCRFGEMNIFHRYENASGKGAIQFSIVNSVEPGSFDLNNIEQFSTPGVCFFVKVPGPQKPIQAFDYMVETAQCLVKNLNGELRDETHSVMTSQTLEHCRNRIREIERKQLTHA